MKLGIALALAGLIAMTVAVALQPEEPLSADARRDRDVSVQMERDAAPPR